MTDLLHALELNAAGLVVASATDDGVRVAEPVPAVAVYEGDVVVTGVEAARRARRVPLWASSRHFEELATDPLPRQRPLARSNADLVYAQLVALAAAHPGGRWLLAAPGTYGLDRLQLLLGVARAAKLAVGGVVDAAVAACADHAGTPRAFHLDLEVHRATLTELVRGDDLRRGRVTSVRAAGRRAYDDACAQLLARLFVRATRFDPLLQAATEQMLYDALPDWLARAGTEGETGVVLEHGGLRHEARLSAAQLASVAAPLNAELVKLLHSARRAGEAVTLYVTDRVAALPGIGEEFAKLRDCTLVVLPGGAAATGALAHAAEILLPSVPEGETQGAGSGDAPGAAAEIVGVNRLRGAPAALPEHRTATVVGAADAPTHLVFQGRAYALSAEPLVIGRGAPGPRRIAVDGAGVTPSAGISRSHCTLLARAGEVVLEDHSSFGTYVNGERVQRRARLRAGDRIRVGTPGAELDAVRLAG